MSKKLFTSEDEAIRTGGSKAEFQAQERVLTADPAELQPGTRAALKKLEVARERHLEAERAVLDGIATQAEWDTLVTSRNRVLQEMAVTDHVFAALAQQRLDNLEWLAGNIGSEHHAMVRKADVLSQVIMADAVAKYHDVLIKVMQENLHRLDRAIADFGK